MYWWPEAALEIGRAEQNPEKIRAVYQLGRNVALKRLREIREFLNDME